MLRRRSDPAHGAHQDDIFLKGLGSALQVPQVVHDLSAASWPMDMVAFICTSASVKVGMQQGIIED